MSVPAGRATIDSTTSILTSDRETLPFPDGGVFGRASAPEDHADLTLREIDRLQRRVNELSRLVDDSFGQELRNISDVVAQIGAAPAPTASDDDNWRPTAA